MRNTLPIIHFLITNGLGLQKISHQKQLLQQITVHTLAFQFCYIKMTVMNAVNLASTSLQSQTAR